MVRGSSSAFRSAWVWPGGHGGDPGGCGFGRMPFIRRHALVAPALFIAFVNESWEQLACEGADEAGDRTA